MSRPDSAPPFVRAGADATRQALVRALAVAGEAFPASRSRLRDVTGAVRAAPEWVATAGALAAGSTTWVWCQGRPGAGSPGAGQLVLDLPVGRYLCDVLDVGSGAWCARESAAGGPLVVGLPPVRSGAIVRIARVRGRR